MGLNTTNATWSVVTTTAALFNGSTTTPETADQDDYPYFRIFGKTYFGFILLIALFGLVGNGLSFALMRDSKVNFFAYSVYMRWLAVSDSLVLITVCTEDITDVYGYLNDFLGYSTAICKLWNFIEMTVRTLSPWLIVTVTFDRFVCVLYPPLRSRFCTKPKALLICLFLTFILAIVNIGQLTHSVIKDGECQGDFTPALMNYAIFQSLIGISLLPCLFIFVLNCILVKRIRRSFSARQNFERTDTQGEKEQDKSTRPLIMVSIFAFITLVPIGVTQVVEYLLSVKQSDHRALRLANELWPLFNLLYLLNFGQNFYVMMASSPHYRTIMASKLSCLNILGRYNSEEDVLIELPVEESPVPEIYPHS